MFTLCVFLFHITLLTVRNTFTFSYMHDVNVIHIYLNTDIEYKIYLFIARILYGRYINIIRTLKKVFNLLSLKEYILFKYII